jgi:hypothetical protein
VHASVYHPKWNDQQFLENIVQIGAGGSNLKDQPFFQTQKQRSFLISFNLIQLKILARKGTFLHFGMFRITPRYKAANRAFLIIDVQRMNRDNCSIFDHCRR